MPSVTDEQTRKESFWWCQMGVNCGEKSLSSQVGVAERNYALCCYVPRLSSAFHQEVGEEEVLRHQMETRKGWTEQWRKDFNFGDWNNLKPIITSAPMIPPCCMDFAVRARVCLKLKQARTWLLAGLTSRMVSGRISYHTCCTGEVSGVTKLIFASHQSDLLSFI